MSAVAFALIAAFLVGSNKVAFSLACRRNVGEKDILVVFYILGAVFSCCFYPLPRFSEIQLVDASLLILNGVVWAVIGVLDLKVYRAIEPAAVALLDSFQLVLLAFCGVVIFGDALSTAKLLGIACIASTIVLGVGCSNANVSRAVLVKFISILLIGFTMSIDKLLITRMPISNVVIFGYALPGVALMLYSRPAPKKVLSAIFELRQYSVLLPLISIGAFSCTLNALRMGELSETMAIIQTSTLFTFVLDALNGGAQKSRTRAAACACLCTIGAIAVVY